MNEGIRMAAGLTAGERARWEWLRLAAAELIEVGDREVAPAFLGVGRSAKPVAADAGG
jgi:hypothetical protein